MKPLYFISGLVFALAILLPEAADAQQFQNVNKEFPMGLSEEIFQDKEGFLWIGTVNGLIRFDGYETHAYTHDPIDSTSIDGNNINAIGQDDRGRIWVGLRKFGVNILDTQLKSFTPVCIPDSTEGCLRGISVNALAPAGPDAMWVGSSAGLFRFSTGEIPEQRASFYYSPHNAKSLSNDHVLKIFVDSRGRMWAGTNRGINLYDGNTNGFVNHRTNNSFPDKQTLDIAEDHSGRIWLSTRYITESLLVYDESTGDFVPALQSRSHYTGGFKICFDLNNDLWIAARGTGAYYINMVNGEEKFFNPNQSNIHGYRNIYGVNTLTDRYGNVWITGNHLMVRKSTGKAIGTISTNGNNVISVYADNDAIWHSENELKRFDRKQQESTPVFPPEFPTRIRSSAIKAARVKIAYCMRELDADHIIFSTTRNIFIWNIKTGHFREFPLDFGGPFREFVITPDKQHLWICSNQGSPIFFDIQTGETSKPEFVSSILNPRCVAQAQNGDLWFGSGTNGVYHYASSTQAIRNYAPDHPDPTHRITDYSINDILISGNNVWVATNLGLDKISISENEVLHQNNSPNSIHESCMALLEDETGALWIGTQRGLIRFDPGEATLRHFDQRDGLINAVYTHGACYKGGDGTLYFGGDMGVDYFNPMAMGKNNIPPDIYLSKIMVNNSRVDTIVAAHHLQALDLKSNENFIELELLALHLASPRSNTYAYRIPELDTAWRNLGTQRNITLANMRPGTYTVEARAANADGVWSGNKSLLRIRIQPPFWATWWFISLGVLALGVAFTVAYRYHIHQIETRERLKSKFAKQVAELESKALRSQMNPHFLFNSLNSVKSLISQGNTEKATQYLTRFGQLIRQILANSEKPFVRLQEELEALRLYLEIEQLRFQNFTFRISVNENVNADFIEVPPLILQPYVENAIWHGLMHQDRGDRRLTIEVNREGQRLFLTIEDNGIGRENAQKIKTLGNSRKGGMGMRLTQDRLNLLRGIYGQDVSIVVSDLEVNGKAAGTRVAISIPCQD